MSKTKLHAGKRLLVLVLALFMVLSLLPTSVFAADGRIYGAEKDVTVAPGETVGLMEGVTADDVEGAALTVRYEAISSDLSETPAIENDVLTAGAAGTEYTVTYSAYSAADAENAVCTASRKIIVEAAEAPAPKNDPAPLGSPAPLGDPAPQSEGATISLAVAPTLSSEGGDYATVTGDTEVQWIKQCNTTATITAQVTMAADTPADAIKIYIPKTYWQYPNSTNASTVTMGVLSTTAFEQAADEGDYFVLSNASSFKSGETVTLTVPYTIGFNAADQRTLKEQTKTFSVSIKVGAVTTDSNSVKIGFTPTIYKNASVRKYASKKLEGWNKDWGEVYAPYDTKDYFFVLWTISDPGTNASENYTLEYSDIPADGGQIVAWRNSTNTTKDPETNKTTEIWYNSKVNGAFATATVGKSFSQASGNTLTNSEYVVVAYKTEDILALDPQTVHNTASVKLTGLVTGNTKTLTDSATYTYVKSNFFYIGDAFSTWKSTLGVLSDVNFSMIDIANNAETSCAYSILCESFGFSSLFAKLAAEHPEEYFVYDENGRLELSQDIIDWLSTYHYTSMIVDDMVYLDGTLLGAGDYEISKVSLSDYREFDMVFDADGSYIAGGGTGSEVWPGSGSPLYKVPHTYNDANNYAGVKVYISYTDPTSNTDAVWQYYGRLDVPAGEAGVVCDYIFTDASGVQAANRIKNGATAFDTNGWLDMPDNVLQVKFTHETDDYVVFYPAVQVTLKPSANVTGTILKNDFDTPATVTNINTMIVVPNKDGQLIEPTLTNLTGYFVDIAHVCNMEGTSENIKAQILARDSALYDKYMIATYDDHELPAKEGEEPVIHKNEKIIAHHASADVPLEKPVPQASMRKDSSNAVTPHNNYFSRLTTLTALTSVDQTKLGSTGVATDVITEQREGTFYDLLPAGTSVNENTIRAYTAKGGTGESTCAFTVQQVPNWRGSGRTMLIVKVTAPEGEANMAIVYSDPSSGFKITFELNIPYDLYKVKATDINYAAYMGQGNLGPQACYDSAEKDIPTEMVPYFTDLDNDGNPAAQAATNTMYALASVNLRCTQVIASQTVSGKLVRVADDFDISGSIMTDQVYTYALGLTADAAQTTDSLIFYDNLEQYAGSSWQGDFMRVDTYPLVAKDIAPVVYYSTQSLDVSNAANRDLTDTSKWTVTVPADPSTVKTVAIDATKTSAGTDAVLARGENYRVEIVMRAPSAIPAAGDTAKNGGVITYKVSDVPKVAPVGSTSVTLLKTYTVNYDLNGGNSSGYTSIPAKQNVGWDEASLLPTRTIVRPGYSLTGWVVSSGAASGTPEATAASKYSDLAKDKTTYDITLQAQWAPAANTSYKVEYYLADAGGNYPASATQTQYLSGTTEANANWSLTKTGLDTTNYNFDKSTYTKTGTPETVIIHPNTTTIAGDGSLTYKVYYLPKAPTTAAISGSIWVDANLDGVTDATDNDGIRNNGEAAYPGGATVKLMDGVTEVQSVTSSTTDGSYSFTNVPVGKSYTVVVTLPAGYAITKAPSAGVDNKFAAANATAAVANLTAAVTNLNCGINRQYGVTYNANGGSNPPADTARYFADGAVTVKDKGSMTRLSFGFTGWNTAADGSGTHYDAGDTLPAMTANLTLYAQWLKLEKSSAQENPKDTLKAGEKVTYTIKITVPEAAASVTVTDRIPTGTTYNDDADNNGSFANGKLTWNLGAVTAGQTFTLFFSVTVDKSAQVGVTAENTAKVEIGGNSYDTNTVKDAVEIVKLSALDRDNTELNRGENINYTIRYTNSTAQAQTNVVITDAIPADTTYVDGSISANGDASALTNGKGTLTWTIPTVAAGATVEASFTVKTGSSVADGTLIKNTASAAAAGRTILSNETVDKLVYASIGPGGPTTYTATLVKVDSKDSATFLPGAKFELYKVNAGGSDTLIGAYTTDANGKITASGLIAGDYCWVETGAPSGYELDSGRHEFAVNASGSRTVTVSNVRSDVPEWLNGADHYAYIIGYPDGSVHPQANITRAEVATIFFRLLNDDVRDKYTTKSSAFSDVSDSDWFCRAVSTMAAMGIVNGYPDGTFNPNGSITRAELAAIAARFDKNGGSGGASFSDILSHWAEDEIYAAANNGWVSGYPDGTFRPDQLITRAEAMTLVDRVLQRVPEFPSDLLDSMIKWKDNMDTDMWYYLAVQEATNSHGYERKTSGYETWTELNPVRDWAALEK